MNTAELEEFERKQRTTEWKPTIQGYLDQADARDKVRHKKNLLAEARQAASWGVPDRESIGYSQSDLCSIISKLVAYIETH